MPKTKKPAFFLPKALVSILIISLAVVAVSPFFDSLKPKTKTKWEISALTYKTLWKYTAGGHEDQIGFTLTLEGDTIKDVKVDVYTENKESIKYQTNFGKELPKLIVGKKLSDIANLDRVSGASGTTNHFKDAVAKLEKELQS